MSSNPVVLARFAVVACLALVACSGAESRPDRAAYAFRPLVTGLDSPVYVTAAPGQPGRLYVVEQPGRIRILQNGRVTGTFLDVRNLVVSGGEQGLLGLAFHPAFATNHRFYVNYTDTNGNTRVVEYRSNTDGTQAIADSARRLLFVRQPYPNHNGGNLQFDRKGLLYVGMGDGGSGGDPGNRAQNLAVRLGKLMRINPLKAGARWQIVGYGLRNPWRFSFDRSTGDLWIGDVGQGSWEEIDYRARARIGKLANYGWNRYEGRSVYDDSNPLRRTGGLVFPTWVYSHDGGACSVTGGYVYRGTATPAARGRYFFGDYCSGHVWSFRVGKGRTSTAVTEPFSIADLSSFGEDGAGELYATSLNGTLYALRP
jgi:glucose/arabinose dehydrogenase